MMVRFRWCWEKARPNSRLIERKDHESSDENRKRQGADDDDRVSPSHIVGPPAARRFASFARRERRVAGVVRYETPRDERGDHDTDGLESRQGAKQEPAVVGKELEGDGGVDRDVAADAESDAECEEAKRVEVARSGEAAVLLSVYRRDECTRGPVKLTSSRKRTRSGTATRTGP